MVAVMMMMMVVAVAVVPAMVVVIVPAAVMDLFGRRHAVCRRPEPGRRKGYCRCSLRRSPDDRQAGERHQNEVAHGDPSVAAADGGRTLNPQVIG